MEASFKARKGGPYKLNLHPKAFFDGNPYKSDRRKYFFFVMTFIEGAVCSGRGVLLIQSHVMECRDFTNLLRYRKEKSLE